jgi:hypothetical protein
MKASSNTMLNTCNGALRASFFFLSLLSNCMEEVTLYRRSSFQSFVLQNSDSRVQFCG